MDKAHVELERREKLIKITLNPELVAVLVREATLSFLFTFQEENRLRKCTRREQLNVTE